MAGPDVASHQVFCEFDKSLPYVLGGRADFAIGGIDQNKLSRRLWLDQRSRREGASLNLRVDGRLRKDGQPESFSHQIDHGCKGVSFDIAVELDACLPSTIFHDGTEAMACARNYHLLVLQARKGNRLVEA
ncbi:hypothetical protein D9M69_639890 [compost metagenome]